MMNRNANRRKVGILTLHEADNYGAVLQAYALQATLKRLGADVRLVSFRRKDGTADVVTDQAGPLAARIRKAALERAVLFQSFRDRYLNCDVLDYGDAGLQDYDLFVAGSDQVWNPQFISDGRYLLPFASPEKRASYAASFGTSSLPEKLADRYKEYLSGFVHLSVREQQGRDLLKGLTGRDAVVSLDPVLLLDVGEWSVIADESRKSTGTENPYVFLYLVTADPVLEQQARIYADEHGMGLHVLTAGFLPKYGFDSFIGNGPGVWVDCIRRAACVYTNSFHGMAFSFLFDKECRTALLKHGIEERNGRLEEFMFMKEHGNIDNNSVFMERKSASLAYLDGMLEKGACI